MYDYIDQIEYPGLDLYLDDELYLTLLASYDYTDYAILLLEDTLFEEINLVYEYVDAGIYILQQAVDSNTSAISDLYEDLAFVADELLIIIEEQEQKLRDEIAFSVAGVQDQITQMYIQLWEYLTPVGINISALTHTTASTVDMYLSALYHQILLEVTEDSFLINTVYVVAVQHIFQSVSDLSRALGYGYEDRKSVV